ncbi:four helix bundle protein [Flavobacterium sp.]|uniref:four helix bundle protein n=1 Tax=Flavobacterium sp. TaxID=239 RepID=UPI002FDA8E31
MRNDNVVQIKSYAFAVRIIEIFKYLSEQKKEYVLSKQLLRCGTSIGANIEEAIGGQSSIDFYAKLTISYKEARETNYWIRLLKDTNYLPEDEAESLLKDVDKLLRIIGSIQKTLRNSTNS